LPEDDLVRDVDRIVERVLARAKIPGAARRREIERELRDHVEDMAEEDLDRFGSPEVIGDALARVYAPERVAAHVARSVTLVIASGLVAAVIIAGVQVVMTAATLRAISSEIAGFAAVALGYSAAYLARRQFRLSLPAVVGVIVVGACWIGVGLSVLAPRHAVMATVAFLSTACGGLLMYAPVPLVWLAGTAGPLLIASVALGPLVPGAGWFPWRIWIGLSLSCVALRLVVRVFERYLFTDENRSEYTATTSFPGQQRW
jgi:hypothetical protein